MIGLKRHSLQFPPFQDKLSERPNSAEKPWMKFAGIAAHDPVMVAELRRIEQIVDQNFEQIEEEEWK